DVARVVLERTPIAARQTAERLEHDRTLRHPPGSHGTAADERDGTEHAVPRHDLLVVAEGRFAVSPAMQDGVEGPEQARRPQLGGRRTTGEVDEAVLALAELGSDGD